MSYSGPAITAGVAFDTIADQYDAIFTETLIGRAQRNQVWTAIRRTFRSADRVLELNCGTGEDAVFLARMGISVVACDASERMVSVAGARIAREQLGDKVQVVHCPTERVRELSGLGAFDAVFSNFSGLNCVHDLRLLAEELAPMVKVRGKLLLCLSSRLCLWEIFWFLSQGKFRRAFRRWGGAATASLGGVPVEIAYPTVQQIARSFAPAFRLKSRAGIGIAVPPSYVESVARRHPELLEKLRTFDQLISRWPVLRATGDHMLLTLERTEA